MEIRELRVIVAVAEEGSLSAAARRLQISQSAMSQTVSTLERQLGVELLVRSSAGVRPTDAGRVLLSEAQTILALHDRALLRVLAHTDVPRSWTLRIGVPLEFPPDVLSSVVRKFSAECPEVRVQPRHLSSTAQLEALRAGELEVGLTRERPAGRDLDAMLILRESQGVFLAADVAAERCGPDGVDLDALSGLEWVGFPRQDSPAWYDEVVSVLRSHGLAPGQVRTGGLAPIAEVKLAAVSTGKAFAWAPPAWSHAVPEGISRCDLLGHPLVRRTWAVWPAGSHDRALARFIAFLPDPDSLCRAA
jgi:DNA-binding transcriptional LysR family regulator